MIKFEEPRKIGLFADETARQATYSRAEAIAARFSADVHLVPIDADPSDLGPLGLAIVAAPAGGGGKEIGTILRAIDAPLLAVRGHSDAPYRRVLAAIDFSAPSMAARRAARAIARNAELHLVHVWHVPFSGFTSDKLVKESVRADAARNLQHAVAEEQEAGAWGAVHAQLLQGEVVGCLQKCADALGPDLLVLGSRGQGGFSRLVLGSVVTAMLENRQDDLLAINPDTSVKTPR